MNCKDIQRCLSEGIPLDAAAQAHLETCAGCSAMMRVLTPSNDAPDPRQIERIRKQLTTNLKPVRPLPSNKSLILQALIFFVAFSCLATIPVGFYGFHAFTLFQKTVYYGAILVFAFLLSVASVQQMIPGSRRTINSTLAAILSLGSLGLVAALLFQHFDFSEFVRFGVSCFRRGAISALISGGLAALYLRKSFLTSPVQTGLIVGLLAGLSGFAVLALHCSFQNAPHIIVWHLGAMLFVGLVGAGVGLIGQRLA